MRVVRQCLQNHRTLACFAANACAARSATPSRDAFDYALNCHCSNCRRATGSAFKPFAGIARDRLQLVRGDHDLMIHGETSGTSPHDVRCKHCGSLLWSVVRQGTFVHVAMGTLVDPPSIRPKAHIFAGSRAPWHEITDDLPQYVGHIT